MLQPHSDLWNAYLTARPRETKYPPGYIPSMVNAAAYAPPTQDISDDDAESDSSGEEGEIEQSQQT